MIEITTIFKELVKEKMKTKINSETKISKTIQFNSNYKKSPFIKTAQDIVKRF